MHAALLYLHCRERAVKLGMQEHAFNALVLAVRAGPLLATGRAGSWEREGTGAMQTCRSVVAAHATLLTFHGRERV